MLGDWLYEHTGQIRSRRKVMSPNKSVSYWDAVNLTGTGKTLSLLCASLGWLKLKKDEADLLQATRDANTESTTQIEEIPGGTSNKLQLNDMSKKPPQIDLPKIIYASRTHSQLTQVIKELKGTSYNYMRVGVLASRDQLCIHPDLTFESNAVKTDMCQAKIKERIGDPLTSTVRSKCSYYDRYKTIETSTSFCDNGIMDVEDLRSAGVNGCFCPYYMSKTLIEDADIVFMPYNYLLDPKIRSSITVELKDAVIILDEAHNVPQVCEDSASIEFKTLHITDAVSEVKKIASFIDDNRCIEKYQTKSFKPSELNELEKILLRFEKAIEDIPLSRKNPNSLEAAEFDGDYIYTIMENADIAYHTSVNILLLISNALKYVSECINLIRSENECQESTDRNCSNVTLPSRSPGLRMFKNILWSAFPVSGEDIRDDIKQHYRVYVAYDTSATLIANGKRIRIVNFWCFSPKFGLEYLLHRRNVRSIIFTSGTISPLQPFVKSLGIPIDVRLQNGHIIDPCQVLVEIVSHGPDSEELCSNFENRNKNEYLQSLGNTVLKLSEVVPNGLLIFFPSYTILSVCRMNWQKQGIWDRIATIKKIFVEPQTKSEFPNTMKNYYKQINNATMNGAIFMAVCRGKVSEGLDFADINGRAVIITGIPFPPLYDAKVRLKRNYMQKNWTARKESLSGDEWYQLEASRAINQAIGRVIRHRHDYGAILLCDIRFNKPTNKKQLSQWIQRHIQVNNSNGSFEAITSSVSQFFRTQQRTVVPSSSVEVTNMHANPTVEVESKEATSTVQNGLNGNSTNLLIIPIRPSVPESPITSFTRQMASLPLFTPNSSYPVQSTSANNGNVSSCKQRCTINLCHRFNDEN